MKDIIKIGMFVAVEEPSGKTAKLVSKAFGKYEPQITRIVDAATNLIVEELKVEEKKKDES